MTLRLDPDPCNDAVTRENWGIQDQLNDAQMVNYEVSTSSAQNLAGPGDPYVTTAIGDIFLPRTNDGDPNVRPGIDLPFVIDRNGRRIGIGPYMDDKIGTVKMWRGLIGAIPRGWQQVSDGIGCFLKVTNTWGTETAAGNTGSAGVTITGATGAASPGGSCGGTTDSGGTGSTGDTAPAITGDTDYATTGLTIDNASGNTGATNPTGSVSGTIGSNTTGITLSDHAAHAHAVTGHVFFTYQTTGIGTGYKDVDTTTGTSTLSHSGLVNDPGHTHSLSGASVTIDSHVHTLGSHSHGITEGSGHRHGYGTLAVASHHHSGPSHAHTFSGTISVASHTHSNGTLAGSSHAHTAGEPASFTVVLIERVD